MPKNVLGTKLKRLRKRQNITQNELSQKLGFSDRYIAKIEAGTRPSMDAFSKLANFFEVPVEYLVSEQDEVAQAPLQNAELLKAFIEVDRMNPEEQRIVLELLNAFIAKRKAPGAK